MFTLLKSNKSYVYKLAPKIRIDNNKGGKVWFEDVKIVKGNSAKTTIIEEKNYYSFGLKHRGYNNIVSSNGNATAQKKGFANEELEEELGKNTIAYQWRDYDPAIAKFNKIDRFAEKYQSMTPYHFSANNPIYFREIAGDSISVARAVIRDNNNNTNNVQRANNELQTITGLTLDVDQNTGLLSYATDGNGNPIIATTTDDNGNVVQVGSASARADLISLIDANGVINVDITSGNRSATSGANNEVTIGMGQINSFVNGTPQTLNNNTLGLGMTLLHEFQHTNIGGGLSDPSSRTSTTTGPVVNRINIYRRELDNNPSNTGQSPYGQRTQYYAIPNSSGTGASIKFSSQTINRRGRTVTRRTRIIY